MFFKPFHSTQLILSDVALICNLEIAKYKVQIIGEYTTANLSRDKIPFNLEHTNTEPKGLQCARISRRLKPLNASKLTPFRLTINLVAAYWHLHLTQLKGNIGW